MASSDQLLRWVMTTHNLRVATALTTDLVAEAATRHQLSPVASAAVGNSLTTALLLATLTKGKERVTLQILGDGPIGSVVVDATNAGTVRGYALHPSVGPAAPLAPGHISTAETVGKNGKMSVLRDLGLKDLYQGQVALATGEVDQDVENYLQISEQVPSALGCEVVLDADGRVRAAGGVLVQALPGGDQDSVAEAKAILRSTRFHDLLAAGETSPERITAALFGAESLLAVGEPRPLRFACTCSKERIDEMLALLGVADLDEMIAEGKDSEITCNYCNTHYQVSPTELLAIRARRVKPPRQAN